MPFESNHVLDQRPAACNRKIFAGFEIEKKKKKVGGGGGGSAHASKMEATLI